MRFIKFLLICLFINSYSVFTSIKVVASVTDESPEYIEKVKSFLFVEASKHGQKGIIAKKVNVSSPTLNKFISNPGTIKKKTRDTILSNFKIEYSRESAEFIAQLQPQLSQSSTNTLIIQPPKMEPSQNYPCLNICTLPFNKSFPKTYTLLMVDSALIPVTSTTCWNQYPNFQHIGSRFLRPSIAEDKKVSFTKIENEAYEKKLLIMQSEKLVSVSQEERKPYYIVQSFKKREEQKTGPAHLIKSLTEIYAQPISGFEFQAALIIFPYPNQKAMIYGFGYWNTLLNPDCIIPQWGLRLATSGQICNPNRVKTVTAEHYRTTNPYSRREKASDLQPIETFGLVVGAEGLETIALMPNKSIKTHHVIEASNYLQFTVNPIKQATLEQSVQSLDNIAAYFFNLAILPTFHIHSRMREFIDDEIKDESLIKSLYETIPLNKELFESIFKLHDTLWIEMKDKKLIFGSNQVGHQKYSIYDALFPTSSLTALPQKIAVWTQNATESKEFEVLKIFYSLPYEYQGKYYRFDRKHWYQVDPSRFEGIKRILRKTKRDSSTLRLPNYSIEDTERSTEQKKADYKEAKYNLRAVQTINQNLGYQAILLDRINVFWKGPGNKFEFADLLVIHDNMFHIVHVKRDGVSALSHHREQVERSVDFLATELNREIAHEILLQGLVNILYENHKLPIKKEKNQGKRITKGNTFLDFYNSLSSRSNFLSILEVIPILDSDLFLFKQQALKQLDKEFFKKYPVELVVALDALWDCVWLKQEHLSDSDMTMHHFLEAMKEAIIMRDTLFPNGILKEDDLKKIKIVLAVIDDNENTKKQIEIFKNQDLWGLDRTRMHVEKAGFGFTLMVINEHKTDTWDAFGPIIKKERKERFVDLPGDEPESFPPHSIKPVPSSQPVNTTSILTRENLPILFNKTGLSLGILDVSTIQKLQYIFPDKSVWQFLVCPTIGDGDCFFHAAFTEEGETAQIVQQKAATMRKNLCDVIQQGQYIDHLRHLVYEHYLNLLTINPYHADVPQAFKDMMKEKNEYTTMYNSMQKFGFLTHMTPQPEYQYPVESIKSFILNDHIKTYMERFRTVGGDETYISFRSDMLSPVDILAELGGKKINIFTFNIKSNQLDFIKSAGTNGPIINILHAGNHFVRLYKPNDDNNSMNQCEQILKNYFGF